MSEEEAMCWGEATLTDVGGDGVTGVLAHRAVEVREADALDAVIPASVLAGHCGESRCQRAPRSGGVP